MMISLGKPKLLLRADDVYEIITAGAPVLFLRVHSEKESGVRESVLYSG